MPTKDRLVGFKSGLPGSGSEIMSNNHLKKMHQKNANFFFFKKPQKATLLEP